MTIVAHEVLTTTTQRTNRIQAKIYVKTTRYIHEGDLVLIDLEPMRVRFVARNYIHVNRIAGAAGLHAAGAQVTRMIA